MMFLHVGVHNLAFLATVRFEDHFRSLISFRRKRQAIDEGSYVRFQEFLKVRKLCHAGNARHPCPILSNRYDPWMAWHDPYRFSGSWDNYLKIVQQVRGSYLHLISKTALHITFLSYLHTDDKQFCRTHTTREWLERQTSWGQCMFFALKTWMPQSAKHDEYSLFSKRESPIAHEYICNALRSPKAGESNCATKNVCSSF